MNRFTAKDVRAAAERAAVVIGHPIRVETWNPGDGMTRFQVYIRSGAAERPLFTAGARDVCARLHAMAEAVNYHREAEGLAPIYYSADENGNLRRL